MALVQLNTTPHYGDPYNILIIGDSRVRHLDSYLTREKDEGRSHSRLTFEVISKPGGGIHQCVRDGVLNRKLDRYHQVYLMAGVCDLSYKRGRKLYPYTYSHQTPDMVTHLQAKYETAYDQLLDITDCPVICDLIGMDLIMYNKSQYDDDYLQDVIDESVQMTNNWLHTFMKSKLQHTCSPYYAHYVYKRRNNRTSCRYHKATIDGLHFTNYYLEFISKEVIKSTQMNRCNIHPNTFNMREEDY